MQKQFEEKYTVWVEFIREGFKEEMEQKLGFENWYMYRQTETKRWRFTENQL